MKLELSKHGTTNSYDKGCRCTECRTAKRDYRKNAPIKEHGKKWSYDKGCRCDECKKAKADYSKPYNISKTLKKAKAEGREVRKIRKNPKDGKSRICNKCDVTKPIEQFSRNKSRKCGRMYQCKVCQSAGWKTSPEGRFSTYKYGAKYRGISFVLTLDQFMSFWNLSCYYCEASVDGIGLDRLDSSRPYEVENVVPCCSVCNRAKGTLSKEEFVSMCKAVAPRFE